MSRTKNAAELYALLIEENYGELTWVCLDTFSLLYISSEYTWLNSIKRIFTLLLRRGRQTIPALVQYTRLPPHHIRHGLAVLIQQNLIYWHIEHESDITYYEANQNASYLILRSGKIIEYVSSRYGHLAQDVIQQLLFMGHAKIGDLLTASSQMQHSDIHANGNGRVKPFLNGNQNGINRHSGDDTLRRVEDATYLLLQSGLVTPVVKSQLQSPSDLYHQVEREVLENHFKGGVKGTKQKDEVKLKIIERLRELRSEGEGWQHKGLKRPLTGVHQDGSEKRRKLTNGIKDVRSGHNVISSEGSQLDHDLIVKINYEKCNVLLRNQRLISLAKYDVGETTSLVYSVLLRLLEGRIARCRLDPSIDDLSDIDEGPTVTTIELTQAMEKSINPSVGIGKVDSHSIRTAALEKTHRKRKRGIDDSEATVEGDASSDEYDNDEPLNDIDESNNIPEVDPDSDTNGDDPFVEPTVKTLAVKASKRTTKVTFDEKLLKPTTREDRMNKTKEIRNHLLLLADCSPHFIRKCGSRGLGEWTVDFDELVSYMQETEVDDYLWETFGQHGCRIARILRQKGKLEEKQIQKFGLLKMKDVRTRLAQMQAAGIVEIQEVSKDGTHAVIRTIFLWYVDSDRVKMIVLEHIYKTMSRFLQVLKAEKHEERDILSQAERTDVVGQEAEVLTPERLVRLNEIRDKEKNIFTQLGRLDTLVAIFKEF